MGKKQIYKKAVALSLATAMVAGSATTALAGQWKQDANGYWWDENGSYPKNEWKWLDGNGEFPIVKDTTPNMMNPRLYTTSYNKP